MAGDCDDRDVLGGGLVFQLARGFPTVHYGHGHVHNDEVGQFGCGHLKALLA